MYVNLSPEIIRRLKKEMPSLETSRDILELQRKELAKLILKKHFKYSEGSVNYNNAFVFVVDQMDYFNIDEGINEDFIKNTMSFVAMLELNKLCVKRVWMLPKLFGGEKVADEDLYILEEKHPGVARSCIGLYSLKTMKAAIPPKPYFKDCFEIVRLITKGKNG